MRPSHSWGTLILLFSLTLQTGCKGPDEAATGPKTSHFPKNVAAILDANCMDCHASPDAYNRGSDLSSWQALMEGTDDGLSIIPYDAYHSFFFQHINTDTSIAPRDEPAMPYARDPLSKADQQTIYNWIEDGALSAEGVVPYADAARLAYVLSAGEDLVSIVDLDRENMIRNIPVGKDIRFARAEEPIALAEVDADHFLVGFKNGKEIKSFGLRDYSLLATLPVGGEVRNIRVLSPQLAAVFTETSNGGSVLLINPALTSQPVDLSAGQHVLSPTDGFLSKDGKSLFVLAAGEDRIVEFDLATKQVVRRLPVGDGVPEQTPDGYVPKFGLHSVTLSEDAAFITLQLSGEVVLFDRTLEMITKRGEAGHSPRGTALLNGELWVTNYLDRAVPVLNATTLERLETVSVKTPSMVWAAADRVKNRIYITAEHPPSDSHHSPEGGIIGSTLTVIDAKTKRFINEIDVPNTSAQLFIAQ